MSQPLPFPGFLLLKEPSQKRFRRKYSCPEMPHCHGHPFDKKLVQHRPTMTRLDFICEVFSDPRASLLVTRDDTNGDPLGASS